MLEVQNKKKSFFHFKHFPSRAWTSGKPYFFQWPAPEPPSLAKQSFLINFPNVEISRWSYSLDLLGEHFPAGSAAKRVHNGSNSWKDRSPKWFVVQQYCPFCEKLRLAHSLFHFCVNERSWCASQQSFLLEQQPERWLLDMPVKKVQNWLRFQWRPWGSPWPWGLALLSSKNYLKMFQAARHKNWQCTLGWIWLQEHFADEPVLNE